jgi:dihydrofolate reductase
MQTQKKYPLRLLAAVDINGGLGLGGELLFKTRADMEQLRRLTMGQILLMGGKTFRSLPNGALPGRINIVLSRKTSPQEGAFSPAQHIIRDPNELWDILALYPGKDCFVFGGAEIYRLFLPYCTRADITQYLCSRPADCFLPPLTGWKKTAQSPLIQEGGLDFYFQRWERTAHLRCGLVPCSQSTAVGQV